MMPTNIEKNSVVSAEGHELMVFSGRKLGQYPGGGGTLGISGWGCAAGILEPLTYTRASSAEFCYLFSRNY